MKTTPITTTELNALLRAGRVPEGACDRHGLHLDNTPENQWAIDAVMTMRVAELKVAA